MPLHDGYCCSCWCEVEPGSTQCVFECRDVPVGGPPPSQAPFSRVEPPIVRAAHENAAPEWIEWFKRIWGVT